MFLGLDAVIWVILVLYFAGMLLMGWWSKKGIHDQEGYLLGNRKFGVWMMVMHAFGAGTNPGDTAGVVSGAVKNGASGIWASWMWMFGTPFYWLIAPIIRRMRCLTMADFFEERFGHGAAVLYTLVATAGMTVCLASVLLATTRTVQGMMGPAANGWFYAILLSVTVTFVLYGYWGGIVAAVRTDMVQGLMIIVLSVLAIPAALALPDVAGLDGMRTTLTTGPAASGSTDYLSLFDPHVFDFWTVIVLCICAPLTALALPHLVSVCGAGRTEWEGRMGFVGGNMLKRICTIGWCVLGLCWFAHLVKSGVVIDSAVADASFGDAIRHLLPPTLQGLMLACVMAAAMSSGDAFQVTVAGLFSQNIYRVHVRPDADETHLVHVTRVAGVVIVVASVVFALFAGGVVKAIMMYFGILALVGLSTAMGMLWRRMNQVGMYAATGAALAVFFTVRIVPGVPKAAMFGLPILAGLFGGIIGSLVTPPPDAGRIETFFRKIHTPIGQEDKLALSLDEVVPLDRRLVTAGGLFIVKPSRQSWVGFVVTLAICCACVAVMLALLSA